MNEAIKFIQQSIDLGYHDNGSVFKVDYSSSGWAVGFWFRPVDWNSKKQEYRLKGRCGKAKDKNLETAILLAIKKATEDE